MERLHREKYPSQAFQQVIRMSHLLHFLGSSLVAIDEELLIQKYYRNQFYTRHWWYCVRGEGVIFEAQKKANH